MARWRSGELGILVFAWMAWSPSAIGAPKKTETKKPVADAGSGSGLGSHEAAAEKAFPAPPVTATSYGYPFLFTERFGGSFDWPATGLLMVRDRGVTAYLAKGIDDASSSASDQSSTRHRERMAYGLTPAVVVKGIARFGFGFDSEDVDDKIQVQIPGEANGGGEGGSQLLTIHAEAALRAFGPYGFGLKYSASRLRSYADQRGNGGVVDHASDTFADIRPSVALFKAQYEVHAEFLQQVQRGAGGAAIQRPSTLAFQYRRTLAPGRLFFGDFAYAMASGLGSGYANSPEFRAGYVTSEMRWGDLGGTIGYRFKRYEDGRAASPDTVGALGVGIVADVRPDAETHYVFQVDGGLSDDKGTSPGGNGAHIKNQTLTYQFSFVHLL